MENHDEMEDGSNMVVEEDKEHLEEGLPQISYPENEIELAAELECKLCDGTGEDSAGKKCKECSTDYDKYQ